MPDPADAMADYGPWHIKKAALHERIRALEAELAAEKAESARLAGLLAGEAYAHGQTLDRAEALNVKANDYARQAQEAEDVANEEHRRAEASDRKLAEARTLMIETDPHRTYRAGCPVCEFLKATRPEHSSDDPARKRHMSAESDRAECEK